MSGFFFFFKQKTAYEMRISDWSSDVCSSDLGEPPSLPKIEKAIRESDFYRDSESIGMRSDIIGCLAPSSSEKRTVIIGLHRDHRQSLAHFASQRTSRSHRHCPRPLLQRAGALTSSNIICLGTIDGGSEEG